MTDTSNLNWQSPYTSKHRDLFFRDGKRPIDFVLVFTQDEDSVKDDIRDRFLNGLIKEQIEIEVEDSFGQIIASTDSDSIDVAGMDQAAIPRPSLVDDGAVYLPTASSGRPTATDRHRLKAGQSKQYLGPSDLIFVKLYAPWEVMARFSELFKLRKPLKNVRREAVKRSGSDCCANCSPCTSIQFEPLHSPATSPFNQERQYLFNIPEERDEFFSTYERALVLEYILRRTRCMSDEELEQADDDIDIRPVTLNIGITKLISDNIFTAAYPLHEFNENVQKMYHEIEAENSGELLSSEPVIEVNNRVLLQRHWASYKCMLKRQPLDYVRYYFGEAIAFYFAWLGYYTLALLPMAIIGLLIFLLSLVRMDDDPIAIDVCKHGHSIIMCPACASLRCKFWTLNNSCWRTQLTMLVDNEGTVIFGVLMALWAIIFLELWKRKEIKLAYDWNVFTVEQLDQPARPEFLSLLFKGYEQRKNPVSGDIEPKIPFWCRQVPFFILSYSTILFAVILTLAALVGIIVYKLVVRILFFETGQPFVQSTASMLGTLTASVINLIVIFIMKFIYDRVAVKMTDLEYHRTQIGYDNSLTLKLYMLQFVNYYASIFYIAFIQGTTAALPGSKHSMAQSTGCDEGNCLFELFLQLTIIMVGKQLLSFLQETFQPLFFRLVTHIRQRSRERRFHERSAANLASELDEVSLEEQRPTVNSLLSCRTDFTLLDPGSRPLFQEYLEMMIQFGFITMFVPAFPLAPLFGFLNNIFEIRLDAKKFLNQFRRPTLDRVKTIGIWFSILTVLSSLAIRTNACVIAFTTNFIDRWVYRMDYSHNMKDVGFKNFTLSYMETSRFQSNTTATYCRYQDYRENPWVDPNMGHTLVFYRILAAKFIFVFLFEIIATCLTSLIASMIPDVPERITRQIMCELKETNNLIAQSKGDSTQKPKLTNFFKITSKVPQILRLKVFVPSFSAQPTNRTSLLGFQISSDDYHCS